MKRDMDLVRKILLEIEEKGNDPLDWFELELPGFTAEQVAYHVLILQEGGLIDAEDLSSMPKGFSIAPKRLTWKGHEFLDAARSDTIWNKVKAQVKDKAGSVSFDVLKVLLKKAAVAVLGQAFD